MAKLTKARIDAAWRHRDGNKIILRDHRVRGLYIAIRTQSATWFFEYRLPGVHPETGRRWPTTTLKLGRLAADFHLEQARKAALAAKAKVVVGVDPVVERNAEVAGNLISSAAAEHTVAKLIDRFEKIRGPRWAAQTRAAFKGDLAVIRQNIGSVPVTKVTRRRLIELLEGLYAAQLDVGHTGARVDRIATLIGSLFRFAVEQGDLDLSPAQRLPRLAGPYVPRDRVMASEELHAVWHTLSALGGAGVGAAARIALKISLATGQRIGTVLGATADELRLDGMADPGMVDDGPIWIVPGRDGTKSRSTRRVPLSALSVALWREALELPGRTGQQLFPGRGKSLHLRQDSVSRAWGKLVEIGELPANTTAHDLRRSARTWWSRLRHSGDQEAAERLLGHAVGSKVRRAYDHDDGLPAQRAIADAWGERLGLIAQGGADVVHMKAEAANRA